MKRKKLLLWVLLIAFLATSATAMAASVKAGEDGVLKVTGGVLEKANFKSKSLYQVKKGERVKVLKVEGKWCTIENKDKKQGWVPTRSMNLAPPLPPKAKIAYVSGDVKIIKTDGSKKDAEVGDPLQEKDAVQTGAKSNTDVEIIGGRDVVLYENSRVIVSKLGWAPKPPKAEKPIISMFKIEIGRLFVALKNKLKKKEKFEIKRGTVVAGVRGTEFRMTAEDKGTAKIEVTESNVDVKAAKKKVALKENFGLRIKKGKKPGKPHALPPPPEPAAPAADTNLTAFAFSWKKVDSGKEYRLEIAKDDGFKQLVNSAIVQGVEFKPDSMTLPLGDYYWRVSTIDKEDFEGKSSTPRKFAIAP